MLRRRRARPPESKRLALNCSVKRPNCGAGVPSWGVQQQCFLAMAKKRRGKRQSGCKVVVATPKRSDAEKRIEAALQADPVDVDVITAEARANALPDALRSRAWMALLRLRDDEVCSFC